MSSIDTKKTTIAGIFFLVAIPVFYFAVKGGWAYLGPDLHEGDRLETRPCKRCAGTGKDREMAMTYPELGDGCPFCKGKGHVEVIVPGPKRPTRIWGAVVDLRKVDFLSFELPPDHVRMVSMPFGPEGPPIPGAIPRARLVFTGGDGAPIEVVADGTGRFSRRLSPGTYRVTASADGFEPLEEEIDVEPLTAPIWQERARLIEELPEDEARSQYGLTLMVGLGHRGEEGRLQLSVGSPH